MFLAIKTINLYKIKFSGSSRLFVNEFNHMFMGKKY